MCLQTNLVTQDHRATAPVIGLLREAGRSDVDGTSRRCVACSQLSLSVVSSFNFRLFFGRAASSVCSNLVSKGLTARTKTAQRSSDALMLFIELDGAEAVVVRALCRKRGPVLFAAVMQYV